MGLQAGLFAAGMWRPITISITLWFNVTAPLRSRRRIGRESKTTGLREVRNPERQTGVEIARQTGELRPVV
jgi:hypothetical protein